MKAKFKKFFWPLIASLLYWPAAALAQTSSSTPQDPITLCTNFKKQFNGAFDWVPNSYCTASGVALFVTKLLLEFSGTAAVIFIMIGGFLFITSAGNEEQSEKGRKILVNAIIGLVVIILATAIVTIVSNTITSAS